MGVHVFALRRQPRASWNAEEHTRRDGEPVVQGHGASIHYDEDGRLGASPLLCCHQSSNWGALGHGGLNDLAALEGALVYYQSE